VPKADRPADRPNGALLLRRVPRLARRRADQIDGTTRNLGLPGFDAARDQQSVDHAASSSPARRTRRAPRLLSAGRSAWSRFWRTRDHVSVASSARGMRRRKRVLASSACLSRVTSRMLWTTSTPAHQAGTEFTLTKGVDGRHHSRVARPRSRACHHRTRCHWTAGRLASPPRTE